MTIEELLNRLSLCSTHVDALQLVEDAKHSFGDAVYDNVIYCIGHFNGETRAKLTELFDFI